MPRLTDKKIALALLVFSCSCSLSDNGQCGMYLEFVFDHNMEYVDSFYPQVGTVDVYLFDEQGNYLFSKHARTDNGLINHKRMYLKEEIDPGNYYAVTVGGMSDAFRFSDYDAQSGTRASISNLNLVRLGLAHNANEISQEFDHVWFGEAVKFEYRSDNYVQPIPVIRETNKFHLVLESNTETPTRSDSPYTFEVLAPEAGEYGYDNEPLTRETICYRPYYLASGTEPFVVSEAKLNTMRLFAGDPDGYRLIVKNNTTESEVWNYDLMELLIKTKPSSRPDGTPLPVQEYLDRQGEWNIVILHRTGVPGSNDEFVALSVKINGWIVLLNDIDI